jgi:hypothetical protein
MDTSRFGSTRANDFNTASNLNYSHQDGSFVVSSNAITTNTLSAGLDAEADHIVMLQYDSRRSAINVPKVAVDVLLQDWRVPAVAVDFFFSSLDLQPHGLSDVSEGSISCCWYHLPVAENGEETGDIHVLQVLHNQSFRVRTLVICPPFMASRMQAILSTLFDGLPGSIELQWPRLHLALVQASIETLKETHMFIMEFGVVIVGIFIDIC